MPIDHPDFDDEYLPYAPMWDLHETGDFWETWGIVIFPAIFVFLVGLFLGWAIS